VTEQPGSDADAWQRIDSYGQFWKPFDETFRFHPGKDPSTWPAIAEPAGSVTMDLASVFARDGSDFDAGVAEVTEQILAAFIGVFGADEALVALRWQHASYWFWPHRQAGSTEPWVVPALPNGDYVAVVTPDLTQGTFGHPWEQTLCVFGHRLVAALLPRLEPLLEVKRLHH
jgi:hypothetical protein